MITLLVGPAELDAGEVAIEGDPYRHLFRARRVRVGDRLRLTDGHGRARWGEVAAVDRRAGTVRLGGPAPGNEPVRAVHLLVAPPERSRLAWLVEKATELGVVAVRLIETARAPRAAGTGDVARLARVAAAALEQCHRSRLPAITGTHAWGELPALLDGAAAAGGRFVLDTATEGAGDPLGADPAGAAAVLVGPEGGWTDGEREELTALGCRAAGLGPTILRVETAALAAAAVLLACPAGRLAPEGPRG